MNITGSIWEYLHASNAKVSAIIEVVADGSSP
jgi:hypothetical protein